MTNDPNRQQSDRERIEEEAADWIALRYAGLTAEQAADFDRWLAADARNAAVFAELEETWGLLDGVRVLAPANAGEPNANVLAPTDRSPAFRSTVRRIVPLAFAAAAALAVAYLGFWREAALPGTFSDEVATAVGTQAGFDLPDGSRMLLNTDSLVEVRYSNPERRLRLVRGEAHFSVAKMPSRPFFVEAGNMTVKAVGTAFNVKLREGVFEVLVTEGRVSVGDSAPDPSSSKTSPEVALLEAGDRAVIGVTDTITGMPAPLNIVERIEPLEIERALAWQDRRLEFVAAPLREIVKEFNRYNVHRLTIRGDELAERRFGGSFRSNAPEDFVHLLQSRFGLEVERRENETVLQESKP